MNILDRLTGGRPMRRESFAFTDKVSGQGVWYFRDRLGRKWMATSPWASFRVAVNETPADVIDRFTQRIRP